MISQEACPGWAEIGNDRRKCRIIKPSSVLLILFLFSVLYATHWGHHYIQHVAGTDGLRDH